MGKAFFKSCFIVLLSFLSLSCAFVAEANSGDIEFVLPDVKFSDNGRTSRSATISNNQLKFNVSLKNANKNTFIMKSMKLALL